MYIEYKSSEKKYELNGIKKEKHIVTLLGILPENTSGFSIFSNGKKIGDYSGFTTVYRKLDDGIQYSDDGSVWAEPTSDISVVVMWDDEDDSEGIRPESIYATLTYDNTDYKLTLSAENGWKASIGEKETRAFSLVADAVEGYEQHIEGLVIGMYHKVAEITLEDRVTDLEAAVCELAEMIE